MSNNSSLPTCASCKTLACYSGLKEKAPENCPMVIETDLLEQIKEDYRGEMIGNLACNSARIEAEGYCNWTRVEEIINFARRASYRRIGLAYCIGLRREAEKFNGIMLKNGFEMVSVVCKASATPKENIGLDDSEKVKPGHFEAMCNPVAQAKLLNKAKVDLKILLGLCVGHDSLFLHYAETPVTVLAVKDRVLAHNPLGAIYASHYFARRFN
ncbi:MAG: DUF1847 domain-containing protein [Bacillota bacterium]